MKPSVRTVDVYDLASRLKRRSRGPKGTAASQRAEASATLFALLDDRSAREEAAHALRRQIEQLETDKVVLDAILAASEARVAALEAKLPTADS